MLLLGGHIMLALECLLHLIVLSGTLALFYIALALLWAAGVHQGCGRYGI